MDEVMDSLAERTEKFVYDGKVFKAWTKTGGPPFSARQPPESQG